MSRNKHTLIIIVGPTASGKTGLAIKLARKLNGEIISADSRQVYRGMDIGTGKATKQERRQARHYLLDIANPKKEYNVSHFKRDAERTIVNIHEKKMLPFLVGGTAFWVDSVAYDFALPNVKPNKTLRKKLSNLSVDILYAMLKKLDPARARTIDKRNPYRLIRAIEIVKATKKPIGKIKKKSPYNLVWLGINMSREILYSRIDKRLAARIKLGMITEVKHLLKQGVSAKRLISIGLEYRYVTLYIQGKLTKKEMMERLENAIHHYAKRQMTWWKRNKDIHWITSQKQAEKLIKLSS
ncbi:tRNA (adenosine(37)-N6)-dimethylallyltransferase MiaA [Patescibacteria group bacterium]